MENEGRRLTALGATSVGPGYEPNRLIERVAMAVSDAMIEQFARHQALLSQPDVPADIRQAYSRIMARAVARAAISTMREPTPGVLFAAFRQFEAMFAAFEASQEAELVSAQEFWEAMIDAALQE